MLLEVNGSVNGRGMSSCGGIIQTGQGAWILGFSKKLDLCPPTIAELLGIKLGFETCWYRNYRNVIVLSDCIGAINLITRDNIIDHPYSDVEEIRRLITSDWNVLFESQSSEQASRADGPANVVHSMSNTFCFFDQIPPWLP